MMLFRKEPLLFLTIIIVDRVSKFLALSFLVDSPIRISSLFDLFLMKNRGVSWSLFSPESTVGFWLLFVAICLVVLFFSWYVRLRLLIKQSVMFEMCVLAGACSNLMDRLQYGGVIDFIQLHVGPFYWPVFNVADMFVVIGVIGMFLRDWRAK